MTINVKDYGAMGNGWQDDSTAIQAAIDAAPAGSIILFPEVPSEYRISKTITVSRRVSLVCGKARVKIISGNGFNLNANDIQMSGFVFQGSRLADNHSAILINGNQCNVSDIDITDMSHGIRVQSGVWQTINRIRARNITHTIIEIGNVVGTVVEDFRYDTDVNLYPEPQYGIHLWGEGCNFSDVDFIHAGKALFIQSTAIRSSTWTFFNSCSFDTSEFGCVIQGNAANTAVNGVMFDQCWFSSHKTAGILIEGASKVDGVTLNGCHIINNFKEGVVLIGKATNIDFNGCAFSGNSVGNPGNHHNIYSNTSGRKFIRNCTFSDWGGFYSKVGYDILRAEQDGECVIDGNVSMGQITGGYISGSPVQAKIGRNFGSLPSA